MDTVTAVGVDIAKNVWLFRISCGLERRANKGYSDSIKMKILRNNRQNVQSYDPPWN